MKPLLNQDYNLIAMAQQAITTNYDGTNYHHTVGAAVRCGSGRVYIGVNVHSIHGACAEQVALGAAITRGERDFASIVAVRGPHGEEILSPCGNCRQLLSDYAPNCEVILSQENGGCKVPAQELLPYPYAVKT